jgi:hypothetical protein
VLVQSIIGMALAAAVACSALFLGRDFKRHIRLPGCAFFFPVLDRLTPDIHVGHIDILRRRYE